MIQKQSKKLGLYNKYHLHVDTSIGIKHKKDYGKIKYYHYLSKCFVQDLAAISPLLAALLLHVAHLDGLGVEQDEAGGQRHRRHHPEDEVHAVGDQTVAGVRVPALLDQVGLDLAGEVAVRLQAQDLLVLQLVRDAGVRVGEEGDFGSSAFIVSCNNVVDKLTFS